ncbi:MAG: DegV family protein [Evtepia sp.]
MGYTILADSSCDLSEEMARELEITIVPLSVIIDGEVYANDRADLSDARFYDLLRSGKNVTTSGVNVSQMEASMTTILERGSDVLFVGFSSTLSITYKSAETAALELRPRYPDREILTFDSRCGCLGQGLLLVKAVEAKRAGASMMEVLSMMDGLADRICHWFTVSDLHYIRRGGRISASTAILGSVLQIKPIIHLDNNCLLAISGKARGRKNAMIQLVRSMEERIDRSEVQTIYIAQADCLEDANELAAMVRAAIPVKDIVIGSIGPVMSVHGGPGTLALFYIGGPR